MNGIDKLFRAKVEEWLSKEKHTEAELADGAMMVLQCNRNRAMYNTMMRKPSHYEEKMVYELKKHLAYLQNDMNLDDVKNLEKQILPVIGKAIADTEETTDKAAAALGEIPEDSFLPAPALSSEEPYEQTDAIVARGKRTDHDTLPETIRAIWDKNAERYKKIKQAHETCKTLTAACDRYEFTSAIAELWEAYKTQVATVVPQCLIGVSYYEKLWATQLPSPFMSTLFDGCIERGRDVVDGGTAPYSSVGLWVTGTVNVGDSLAAVKKVVFDDKKITMAQLIDALDKNFEGAEDILFLLKKAPKFGNDIDYVDNIVNDVICNLADELEKIKGHAGRKFMMAAATIGYNQAFGFFLGASPDGRRAHEALGEGGISPHQGRNVSGATATTRSVAKLNLVRSAGGNVLNMKFDPSSVDNPTKMMNFVNFLRTFASTGGDVIQFNMVSNEMLLDAQKHPEKYRDLLVRVATYSAYFVEMDPMAQQEIIDRTSFGGF